MTRGATHDGRAAARDPRASAPTRGAAARGHRRGAPGARASAPATTRGAPGSYRAPRDRWGPFASHAPALDARTLVVIDRRVEALHPAVARTLAQAPVHGVVRLEAGEAVKSFGALGRVLAAATRLPRSARLVCIGGGTVGDLATVAAHLHKRGIDLVQVPTTLLAAVDSSVGGKGALDLPAGRRVVKNAAGVFHYARETWLCPELLRTLTPVQLREGAVEAWKMVVTLDARLWRRYRRTPPSLERLVRDGRRLKARVCAEDPYEQQGRRRVLNFGHTFGHVLESLSGLALSHGDAVGLGMLCALDLGRRLGALRETVAREVEAGLEAGPGILGRGALAELLTAARPREIEALLATDKKNRRADRTAFVLLEDLGRVTVREVAADAWRPLYAYWRRGRRP